MVNKALEGDVLKLGLAGSCLWCGHYHRRTDTGRLERFQETVVTSLVGIIICSLATFVLGFVSFGLYTVDWELASSSALVYPSPMDDYGGIAGCGSQGYTGQSLLAFRFCHFGIIPLGLAVAGPTTDAIGSARLLYRGYRHFHCQYRLPSSFRPS